MRNAVCCFNVRPGTRRSDCRRGRLPRLDDDSSYGILQLSGDAANGPPPCFPEARNAEGYVPAPQSFDALADR
jgi:hypothetical protein